jgi:hypothetical protein
VLKKDLQLSESENDLAKKPIRSKNDIKDIRSYKQLDKVNLDVESPRLLEAC